MTKALEVQPLAMRRAMAHFLRRQVNIGWSPSSVAGHTERLMARGLEQWGSYAAELETWGDDTPLDRLYRHYLRR